MTGTVHLCRKKFCKRLIILVISIVIDLRGQNKLALILAFKGIECLEKVVAKKKHHHRKIGNGADTDQLHQVWYFTRCSEHKLIQVSNG